MSARRTPQRTLLPLAVLASLLPGPARGHPMGNFSISHYARFDAGPGGVELTYVLDFAELPTFELLQEWNLDGRAREAVLARGAGQARSWLSGLRISAGGRAISPVYRHASAVVADGAGGLPVLTVTITAAVPAPSGALIEYEDLNYAGRAGWKEIVIVPAAGVSLSEATHGAADRSRALRQYPNGTEAPPQDVKAAFRWNTSLASIKKPVSAPSRAAPLEPGTPALAPTAAHAPANTPRTAGTVVRGDYLSRMLGGREITPGMLFIGLCVAFGLGAMHALSPGHGKTIVAAYLVGSRGTMRHALFLGALVTFTHTISVFALGIGVLFFEKYIVAEKAIPALGAISGLSIVVVGASLLYRRAKALRHDRHHHHHHHHHPHDGHGHGDHHTHPHVHSHVPEGKVTAAGLIALGISGGLVPCPSALVLLLSSIALGRVTLGLGLLIAFSAGLALVLMGIGAMVLYAKHWLPERTRWSSPVLRYLPVYSAAVVTVLGLIMTGMSMGWIQPGNLMG